MLAAADHESPRDAVLRLAPVYGVDGGEVVTMAELAGIDPITVLTFISAVLPLLMQCWDKPERAARRLRRNGPLVRKAVRQAAESAWRDMHDDPAKPVPDNLVELVQAKCSRITNDEMRAIYKARV